MVEVYWCEDCRAPACTKPMNKCDNWRRQHPEQAANYDRLRAAVAADAKPDAEHLGDFLRNATFAGGAKVEPAYSDTKPAYYNAGPDDLIAFALKHNLGAIEFTVMRYVMRWKQKQPLLSLQKAREYLDRLIAHEEERLAKAEPSVSLGSDTNG